MTKWMSLAGGLSLLALGGACSTEKTEAPRACCEQPKIPPGVTPFVVVADEVSGPSDGQKVIMRVGVSQPLKRDQVYPVLHTLYRYAMTRTVFEPIQFVATLYASETAARAGGDCDAIEVSEFDLRVIHHARDQRHHRLGMPARER